jgi:hypothetical protein
LQRRPTMWDQSRHLLRQRPSRRDLLSPATPLVSHGHDGQWQAGVQSNLWEGFHRTTIGNHGGGREWQYTMRLLKRWMWCMKKTLTRGVGTLSATPRAFRTYLSPSWSRRSVHLMYCAAYLQAGLKS